MNYVQLDKTEDFFSLIYGAKLHIALKLIFPIVSWKELELVDCLGWRPLAQTTAVTSI